MKKTNNVCVKTNLDLALQKHKGLLIYLSKKFASTIPDMDYGNLYAEALEVLWNLSEKYDDGFISSRDFFKLTKTCISNRFRDIYRTSKTLRRGYSYSTSLDEIIDADRAFPKNFEAKYLSDGSEESILKTVDKDLFTKDFKKFLSEDEIALLTELYEPSEKTLNLVDFHKESLKSMNIIPRHIYVESLGWDKKKVARNLQCLKQKFVVYTKNSYLNKYIK